MRLTMSDGYCVKQDGLVLYYHTHWGMEHTIQGVVEKAQPLIYKS
jgi:hypothetical protein